jgi:SAM-dependent methyltransferase
VEDDEAFWCENSACVYATDPFPVVSGQPVLIDSRQSIIPTSWLSSHSGSSVVARKESLATRIGRLILAERPRNVTTLARHFVATVKERSRRPRILVVGGGAVGRGTGETIYGDPDLLVVGTDIYATEHTTLLADAHQIPFADESFDGIWIQAVLEHVVDPGTVVEECYRVLVPGGVLFADTPFMQQVHEGAYDFTRFTLSGHRWLFRKFTEIQSGMSSGPALALIWAIAAYVRALTGSQKFGILVAAAFSWLRLLERFAKPDLAEDAACGVYFLGEKSEGALHPRDLVDYYARRRKLRPQTSLPQIRWT